MRRILRSVIVLCLAMAGTAAAQTPPAGQAPPQAPPAQGQGRGPRQNVPPPTANPFQAQLEVQQMFDALVLYQSQKALEMSDQQFAQFFPRMKALQDARRQHIGQRVRLLQELRRVAGPQAPPNIDEATIDARTKALDAAEVQALQNEQKALAAVDEVLTLRQRARFRLFEEQMEREKLRMLARVLRVPADKAPKAGGDTSRRLR